MVKEQFIIMINAPNSGIQLDINYIFLGIKKMYHFKFVKKNSCDVFFIRKK